MQDNGTVQQLSKALNQLLDAYESLQEESKSLKEDNSLLKEEVENLEIKNNELENRLNILNDTTEHNSSEMDTMLGRIETILGAKETDEEKVISTEEFINTNDSDNINSIIDEEIESLTESVTIDEAIEINNNPSSSEKQEENKEIDLGRMQSLLNGFSN